MFRVDQIRILFGVENNVEKDPKAWIVRETDDRLKPTPYTDYPNPEASPVKFFLSPGAPQAGSLVMNKPSAPSYETLTDNFSFSGSTLARAEWTDHRLIYLTSPLKDDLHISGVPSIKIKALSNKSAANLSVWLVTLPWIESWFRPHNKAKPAAFHYIPVTDLRFVKRFAIQGGRLDVLIYR